MLASHDVVLRVGHQAENDARRVAHARDVGDRTVRVRTAIAERDLPRCGQAVRVGVYVAPLAVRDRAVDGVAEAGGPHRHAAGDRVEHDPAAVEATLGIVAEGAGEQSGSGEDLEAVADPDQRPTVIDEAPQRVTHAERQVERQHAAGSERVGVAEAAGDDGESCAVEERGLSDEFGCEHDPRVGAGEFECVFDVVVAVGAGPGDHDGLDLAHRAPALLKASAR